MQHAIVEGEPGIFPDPVARVMRAIGGWFGRRKDPETAGPHDVDGTGADGNDDGHTDAGGTVVDGRAADDDKPA